MKTELTYTPTLSEKIPAPFLIFRAFKAAFSPNILLLSAAASLICVWFGLWSPAANFVGDARLIDDFTKPIPLENRTWIQLGSELLLQYRPYFHGTGYMFYWQIAASFLLWTFTALMISRLAAVRLTVGESHSIKRAYFWATHKYFTVIGALVIALAISAFLWTIALGGLRIPYLNQWLFPIWQIAIFLGLLVSIGIAVAIPMMFSAAVIEHEDCFDTLSRCFAYAVQKPIYTISCLIIAAIIGNFGIAILVIFLNGFNYLTFNLIHLSSMEINSFVQMCMRFVWLIQQFVFNAYVFTSMTAIYLLLRFQIDKVELSEIYLPIPYGLPRHKLPEIK